MKPLLIALVLSAFSFSAYADVNKKEEYNFVQKWDRYSLQQRFTDSGTKFLQLKVKLGDGWKVGYRHVVSDTGNHERRMILDKKLFEVYKFSVLTRLEHRDYRYKEDYFRARVEVKYQHMFNPRFGFWAKLSPRYSFKNDDTVFSSRDAVGLTFKHKNMTFSPFVTRDTNKEFNNHVSTTVATKFTVQF